MADPARAKILGVLNVSPESMVRESIALDASAVALRAETLRKNGADWIDLGGRSITPDAPTISDVEEQQRLQPALAFLAESGYRVSVDTWSEETAVWALAAGAQAINYTGGAIGPPTLDAVAAAGATLFLTFMPYGDAYRMRTAPRAPLGIPEILDHLGPKTESAKEAGIQEVIIDPNLGIIHPETDDHTKIHQQLQIVWNLDSLRVLDCPILLYAARKPERLARIMMASAILHAGADFIRTHTPEMIEELRRALPPS